MIAFIQPRRKSAMIEAGVPPAGSGNSPASSNFISPPAAPPVPPNLVILPENPIMQTIKASKNMQGTKLQGKILGEGVQNIKFLVFIGVVWHLCSFFFKVDLRLFMKAN